MKQILTLSHARKSYDGKVVLDDVTLAFLPGAKIGVVGPNGTGKSTLLRMMAGLEPPSHGDVRLMPGYTVGILAQEPALDEGKTVFDNVAAGAATTRALLKLYREVTGKLAADYGMYYLHFTSGPSQVMAAFHFLGGESNPAVPRPG